MNKKIFKNQKGFTLVEMMVSVFIFALIMASIAGIFGRQISSYKKTRIMANDLENAQFAINYISKTLRTSSIIGDTENGDLRDNIQDRENDFAVQEIGANTGLIVYDFSQEACIRITFRDKPHKGYPDSALWIETVVYIGINEIERCLTEPGIWSGTDYKDQRLTTGNVTGSFVVAPTRYMDHVGSRSTDTIGRATVSMTVVPSEYADNDHVEPVYIQSSVSLRDYPSDLSF